MSFFKRRQTIEAGLSQENTSKKPTVEIANQTKNADNNTGESSDISTETNEEEKKELTTKEKEEVAIEKYKITEKKISDLYDIILNETVPNNDEGRNTIKNLLLGIMDGMQDFANAYEQVPNSDFTKYTLLNDSFQDIIKIKNHTSEQVRGIFEEVFKKFSDFIDDEIIFQTMIEKEGNKEPIDVERITQEVYGRSQADLEKVKRQNRVDVVQTIQTMAEQGEITTDMIVELHRVNNRGIVPKIFSQIRPGKNSDVSFGKRVGILGEDVKKEVNILIKKANRLESPTNLAERIKYEVNAAQIHNALLDIHPFSDRNGSTSLLFLELMMAKAGYQPNAERPTEGYYNFLKKVLNNNFVAVSVVAYEQYMISNVPGYYKGETTKDPDKQRRYTKFVERINRKKEIQKLEASIRKTTDQKEIENIRAKIASIKEASEEQKTA